MEIRPNFRKICVYSLANFMDRRSFVTEFLRTFRPEDEQASARDRLRGAKLRAGNAVRA